MRNISFFLTQRQFKARTKSVTRRLGWKNAKPGDILMGVVKGQGIPKGGSVEKLGPIIVEDTRLEPLFQMAMVPEYGKSECIKEGFPDKTPEEFIEMFCAHNGSRPHETITRIQFAYLDEIFCVEDEQSVMTPALAKITTGGETLIGGTAAAYLPDPPEWFRRMQRRKGVFSNAPETLQLIKSGKEWVDIFFLKKWEVPEFNG